MLMDKTQARLAFQKAADLGCDDPEDIHFHRAVLFQQSGPASDQKYVSLLEEHACAAC